MWYQKHVSYNPLPFELMNEEERQRLSFNLPWLNPNCTLDMILLSSHHDVKRRYNTHVNTFPRVILLLFWTSSTFLFLCRKCFMHLKKIQWLKYYQIIGVNIVSLIKYSLWSSPGDLLLSNKDIAWKTSSWIKCIKNGITFIISALYWNFQLRRFNFGFLIHTFKIQLFYIS